MEVAVVHVGEGGGDHAELFLGVWEGVIDDASDAVGIELEEIRHFHFKMGGEAELAGFEDVVAKVLGVVVLALSHVGCVFYQVAVGVADGVQVCYPPGRIGEGWVVAEDGGEGGQDQDSGDGDQGTGISGWLLGYEPAVCFGDAA